jgi:hypothetical protein
VPDTVQEAENYVEIYQRWKIYYHGEDNLEREGLHLGCKTLR